jgi:hypothetical protein
MRNSKYSVVLLLILLAFSTSITRSQQSNQPIPEYWINLPSAPLRIGSTPDNDGYTLANYNNLGRVVRYRFGCVIQKDKRIVILNRRQIKEGEFSPLLLGQIRPSQELRVTGSHAFPEPICKKGKLAVIEVEFEDGAIWKASK